MIFKRRSKYNAKPVRENGKFFASKAEYQRYGELLLLEAAREISELLRQPKFTLMVDGHLICHYIADFEYFQNGDIIIEDVKGFETPVFKLKWKLASALYPHYIFKLIKKDARKSKRP